MSTNKILIAGVIGGVIAFLLGFLIYGVLLQDFFASNVGSAGDVARGDGEMLWIPLVLGHIAWGMLIALIFGRWAGIKTFITGAESGALIGLLVGATYNLINLGATNVLNVTASLVDIGLTSVFTAIIGGVIGAYYGRES